MERVTAFYGDITSIPDSVVEAEWEHSIINRKDLPDGVWCSPPICDVELAHCFDPTSIIPQCSD
jgi:hypothetical protein